MTTQQTKDKFHFDLTNLITSILHFDPKRVEAFLDELYEHSILVLCSYRLKYQPTSFFTSVWDSKEWSGGRPKPPKGYQLWLDVFEDASGSNYFAFYPKNPKKGKPVKVLYQGSQFQGFVEWVHGDDGLYVHLIDQLVLLEGFPYCSDREMVRFIYDYINRHKCK